VSGTTTQYSETKICGHGSFQAEDEGKDRLHQRTGDRNRPITMTLGTRKGHGKSQRHSSWRNANFFGRKQAEILRS
jgi:hypothetical protein